MSAPPADLAGLHRRNNRESAGLGGHFADHRARVTALLEAPSPDARLAVLGAGNCNDLDLAALAARFREIHLVDLDDEAIARARQRQAAEVQAKLHLHAPVDLSGAFTRLPGFRTRPATNLELAQLPSASKAAVAAALATRYDVVLSTCFLSQLMQSVYVSLGERHPQLHAIACALALGHLRAVAHLVAPGGIAHLVTDVVTTETYPLIELWGQRTPLALLEHLEATDNVFSGTGPKFLRRILATDKEITPGLAGPPQLTEPWLWEFTADRSYLCYAISFRRAGER